MQTKACSHQQTLTHEMTCRLHVKWPLML